MPRKFLVVVDDSPEFETALRYAARRARSTGGRVALLRVIRHGSDAHWSGVRDEIDRQLREEAEALRDRYRRAGYRSSVLTARGGQFRVCVGQFPSRDDAIRLRNRLPPQAPADTWALYLETL